MAVFDVSDVGIAHSDGDIVPPSLTGSMWVRPELNTSLPLNRPVFQAFQAFRTLESIERAARKSYIATEVL
ncbi:hypothetical protein [Ensifer adhaerens]|uniref:hypothetical protein n=1 Tax=Ensifer adhaerens TaxID=106592 RepID=UPI000A814B6E|nr:hypothetical protein [Ensifer adhaerens]